MMTCDTPRSAGLAALAAACVFAATAAPAATFGELAAGRGASPAYAPEVYGPRSYPQPESSCPTCPPGFPSATPEGAPPARLDAPGAAQAPRGGYAPPEAFLPFGHEAGLPQGRLQVWSFGQENSTTDPFNTAGLSTPFMFVPWSTPLSAWTNAQTWNWWRERAGVQPPYW
jgi:hypothetical protein